MNSIWAAILICCIFCHRYAMGASFRKSAPPCRFFLWDAPSAGRYHLCKRLLRGKIYEGLGGKRFVRIKPNSVLEKLYPPSKHSPNRCLICGHSFDNHLKSWWFPNLYSAFDKNLDEMYDKYTVDLDDGKTSFTISSRSSKSSSSGRSLGKRSGMTLHAGESSELGMKPVQDTSQDVFRKREYHKRYVEDISDTMMKGTVKNSKNIQVQESLERRKSKSQQVNAPKFETRRIFDVQYKVPFINVTGKGYTLGSALLLAVTRTLVLERMDATLWLQTVDNRWHEWKRTQ